ncbi:MAG: cation:proton antiporter [Gemmataceae bacterium]
MAYPILLVLAGLLLSLQPSSPTYTLPPDLVFLAFLPPLLYAAAFNTHWPAFRAPAQAISLLAVGLVLFSTVGVAWAAHQFLNLQWGPAFVLGAIVAPPVASSAATAITQRVRVPRVVITLLEGESLVNDTPPPDLAYRMAVAAVRHRGVLLADATAWFLLVAAGESPSGWPAAWPGRAYAPVAEPGRAGRRQADHRPDPIDPVCGVPAGRAPALKCWRWWPPWDVGRLAVQAVFTEDLYAEARSVWAMVEFC